MCVCVSKSSAGSCVLFEKVNSFREQSKKCQIEAGAQRGNLSARIINQIHENVQAILPVSFLCIYAPSAVNTRRKGESDSHATSGIPTEEAMGHRVGPRHQVGIQLAPNEHVT